MLKNLFSCFSTPAQLHANGVLGMNCRNYDYISRLNKRHLYPLVDDKVQTKQLAQQFGITTPGMIGVIKVQHQVKNILQIVKGCKDFVVKPAHGSGGKGVLVISSFTEDCFVKPSGETLTFNELYQHISNILSGLYSLGGQYDVALIEELVHFSKMFKDYSYQGIPDVRIIVYKGYPAMAMMRLATKASGGRANLHQGAVGVGLNILDGTALKAVMSDQPVTHHPDTNSLLANIKVPHWREHLIIGAKAFEMTGLGYLGADIVLDADKGPMMLELNARPGLAIQIANGCGIETVLKKIEQSYPQGLNPEERVDYVLSSSQCATTKGHCEISPFCHSEEL